MVWRYHSGATDRACRTISTSTLRAFVAVLYFSQERHSPAINPVTRLQPKVEAEAIQAVIAASSATSPE